MDITQVLADLQFSHSVVKRLKIDNTFFSYKESVNTEKKIDLDFHVDQILDDTEEGLKYGIARLELEVEILDEDGEIDIFLELQGYFTVSNQTTDDAFKQTLSVNGSAALYSIARSIVMSTTAQAVPGDNVIIPMVNLYKVSEQLEMEDNNSVSESK